MTTSFSPCLRFQSHCKSISLLAAPTKRGLMAFVRSQEEALDFEVAAPINCRSTPYTYCRECGVPRDCSPRTAAGHCSQTSYAFCCGHASHLRRTNHGHFDPNVLESTEVSAAPLLIRNWRHGSVCDGQGSSRSFTDQMLRHIVIRPSVLDRAQPPG